MYDFGLVVDMKYVQLWLSEWYASFIGYQPIDFR